MKKQKLILFSVIFLLIAFALGSYFYKDSQAKEAALIAKKNQEVFIREYSTIIGNKDAKVTLVEFLDPACETCAAFYPLVKDIMKKYPDQIRLVIRYAAFHPDSDYVVKLLEATKKQDKYMVALEGLFKYQKQWASHHRPNIQMVWQIMSTLGIDTDKLAEDMKDPALDKIVEQEMADVKKLGVKKTPGYFVNGKPLQNFGYKQLVELIESEL